MKYSLLVVVLTMFPLTVTAQGQLDGMDLPVTPARLGDNPFHKPPVIQPDDDGDDPRDTPPPVFYGEELVAETDSIFYVLDRSGSMDWDWSAFLDGDLINIGNRWTRAKAELKRSLSGLAECFKFNIIVYDCGSISFAPYLVEATPPNKQDAIAWIDGIQIGGATGTGPAVSDALTVRENMLIVLLTDGEPNCGADNMSGHRAMIRSNNVQRATINVFGIAAVGAYRAFCQGVAADSGGAYFDIP